MVSFLSLLIFAEHLFINYQDDAAFSKASLCNLSSFHCLMILILNHVLTLFLTHKFQDVEINVSEEYFVRSGLKFVIVQIEDKTVIMIRTKSNVDEVVG
jgi:hypothetical protein